MRLSVAAVPGLPESGPDRQTLPMRRRIERDRHEVSSNIRVVSEDGTVNVLPAITADTDSRAAIQAAFDWCEAQPGKNTIYMPAGVWKIGGCVELVSDIRIEADGVELQPFDPATHVGPLLVAGSLGRYPAWSGSRARCDNVEIVGLTLNQLACTSEHSHCLFVDTGDNWKLTRVKFLNAKHEGAVSGGTTRDWLWDRCEAHNCGAGSTFRAQSGAGLNCNGIGHVVIKPLIRDCGQGIEHGGIRITIIEPDISNAITPAGPSIGITLGNSVIGLHSARVLGGSIAGYGDGLSIGNDDGRCGGVIVDGVALTECGITFRGGKPDNVVPTPDQGPDLEPSIIRRIKYTTANDHGGVGIQYNPGPAATDSVFGRASLIIEDCEANTPNVEPDWAVVAPFCVFGNVTGQVQIVRPVVNGGRGASKSAGDFQLAGNGANPCPPSMPNVQVIGARAFKPDGAGGLVERGFFVFRQAGA